MRFPADEIHLVRMGEKTRLTIPCELSPAGGYKPCPFKEAGYYVLEREVDVVTRTPCEVCKRRGYRKDGKPCKRCFGHGERVYYTTRVERVEGEERLQVLTRVKLRPQDITDDQALEEGWESADEWRDAFFATHGDCEWVWALTFELTKQVPQYMALQHGIVDPQQYVTTPDRALDDVDSPTGEQYREWAEHSETEQRRQREIRRLEDRRAALDEKIEQMRRKAA